MRVQLPPVGAVCSERIYEAIGTGSRVPSRRRVGTLAGRLRMYQCGGPRDIAVG